MSVPLPPPPPPPAPKPPPTPIWKQWWIWVIVAVVVLGAVGALSDTTTGESGDGEPTTGEPTTTSTTTTTPPPPPVIVPNVAGEQTEAARDLLQDADLAASIEQTYSREPKGVVLRQWPEAGTEVEQGTAIGLVVAQPFPRIPNVIAKNLSQAKRTLRNAGFNVDVEQQQSTTQRDGDIVSQRPSGGTQVRPGRTVTLVVINNI
jgi:resuscitation-promoting factor RpfB